METVAVGLSDSEVLPVAVFVSEIVPVFDGDAPRVSEAVGVVETESEMDWVADKDVEPVLEFEMDGVGVRVGVAVLVSEIVAVAE